MNSKLIQVIARSLVVLLIVLAAAGFAALLFFPHYHLIPVVWITAFDVLVLLVVGPWLLKEKAAEKVFSKSVSNGLGVSFTSLDPRMERITFVKTPDDALSLAHFLLGQGTFLPGLTENAYAEVLAAFILRAGRPAESGQAAPPPASGKFYLAYVRAIQTEISECHGFLEKNNIAWSDPEFENKVSDTVAFRDPVFVRRLRNCILRLEGQDMFLQQLQRRLEKFESEYIWSNRDGVAAVGQELVFQIHTSIGTGRAFLKTREQVTMAVRALTAIAAELDDRKNQVPAKVPVAK